MTFSFYQVYKRDYQNFEVFKIISCNILIFINGLFIKTRYCSIFFKDAFES